MDIHIETERLVIRNFKDSDCEAVHEYASDEETVRYVLFGPNSWQETVDFVKRSQDNLKASTILDLNVAAESKELGRVIGGVGLHRRPEKQGVAEIGYVFHKQVWGKGIGKEAANAVLDLGFESLDVHRIFAQCHTDNVASYRLQLAIGMKPEGMLRKHLQIKGEYVDTYVTGILRQEWQSQRAAL